MSAQVDQYNAYLDRGELRYDYDEERSIFRLMFDGKNGDIRVVIFVEESMLQVFSHIPNRVPENYRKLIAEAVTRANYGLKLGKFELDLDDGNFDSKPRCPSERPFRTMACWITFCMSAVP